MLALIPMSVVPLISCDGVVILYDPVLVPYSNHTVASVPLALTDPVNIAELSVTLAADIVVTSGGWFVTGVGVGVGVAVGVGVNVGVGVVSTVPD